MSLFQKYKNMENYVEKFYTQTGFVSHLMLVHPYAIEQEATSLCHISVIFCLKNAMKTQKVKIRMPGDMSEDEGR